ncbi:hypothetical protein [Rhodanobacter lindaniclasticus]
MSSLPPAFRHLLPGLKPDVALNFDTYLARLHDSDLAMRALEHDFLDRPQPTVLMHFGDHQPSFGGMIRDLPRTLPPTLQPYRDYLTYYMVKSNFAGPPLPSYPMLDIAFLPGMVLQAAGLPEDAYFAASVACANAATAATTTARRRACCRPTRPGCSTGCTSTSEPARSAS